MGLYERWARGLVRHPRIVLAACGLLTVVAVALLLTFRIDPDVESLIRKDDPTVALTRGFQGDSQPRRLLLVVLRADDAALLEDAIPPLVQRLKASLFLDGVIATREEFAGPRYAWFSGAPLAFLPLETLERLQARLTGPERRAELEANLRRLAEDSLAGKEMVLNDPLGLRWILGEAGDRLSSRFPLALRPGSPYLIFDRPPMAFLRAVGKEDSTDIKFTEQLMRDVDGRLKESLGDGPVRVELAGGYVTAKAQAAIMRRDIKFQFISSAVAVLAFLVGFTRSWVWSHLLFVPIVLAIVWGLGYGSALLGPLTPLAMSMAAIVAGLGSDYPIYLLARFRSERTTRDCDESIVRAQLSLGRPFVGAATTTMGGFLVLAFSQFRGLQQFGVLVFLGFTLCVAISLVLFPVLLLWIGRRPKGARAGPVPWAIRAASLASEQPIRKPLALAIAALGVAAWAGVALGHIPLDLDLRSSMSPDDPGRRVLERLEADLGAAMTPVFALVDRQTTLDDLRAKIAALREQGTIATADGPHELVPTEAARSRVREFLRRTEGWIEPTLRELAALGFRPDPFRKGLESWSARFRAEPPTIEGLDPPNHAALRSLYLYEEGERRFWLLYLLPRRSLWRPQERGPFDQAVRAALGQDVRLLGVYHLPDHQAGRVRSDLTRVGCLAITAVVILTILSLGRLRDGMLALVPVLTATGITLAVCALLGGAIKSMNLAAIPIVIGIGVDGGIHYMAALRARGGTGPAEAILDMGPGYWAATVTTILGFGSIAFSSTPGLSFLGVLVIVGMTASFLATLFMLPALARKV